MAGTKRKRPSSKTSLKLLDMEKGEPKRSPRSKSNSSSDPTGDLAKSEFARVHVTYLGHVVGQGQVKTVDAKIKVISDFPRPESKKQLMHFLGMLGYYRKFCQNFTTFAEPLTMDIGL